MGFILSKSMNENMKSQQEFTVMNAQLQLERQLIMQNEMRERQMAMQIAWSREFLKYFGTFFGIAAMSLTTGAIRRKKPAFLVPIIPLGFVFTYQYDLGYGTLLQRMKGPSDSTEYKVFNFQGMLWEFFYKKKSSSEFTRKLTTLETSDYYI